MRKHLYFLTVLASLSPSFGTGADAGAGRANLPATGKSPDSALAIQKSSSCSRIARYLEQRYSIPKGLLKAIATIESKEHPWVVNVDGQGKSFKDRNALVSYLKNISLQKVNDFYIGPMQLSYRSHKNRMRSLENFADPYLNMEYAARLLCAHKKQYGTWAKAVQYYHSCYPGHNTAYQKRVYVTWQRQEKTACTAALEAAV